ncbi:MAG: hypothetical protein AMXMBFR26_06490 [Porticoccaceae bacterium]
MAFSRSFRFPPALLALLGALALGACQSSSSPQQEQPKPPPAVEPVPTPERTAPAAAGATAEERVEALDRELETSYGAHDAMLREHQANARAEATAIAAEQPPGGRGTEEEGAEQGELYESLPGFGAPPPQGRQDGAAAATAGGEAEEGKGGRPASAAGATAAGGQLAGATVPADIPDARDDDIVARQLREAAQMEKDPQLREKLWDEYRKYKNQQATR